MSLLVAPRIGESAANNSRMAVFTPETAFKAGGRLAGDFPDGENTWGYADATRPEDMEAGAREEFEGLYPSMAFDTLLEPAGFSEN